MLSILTKNTIFFYKYFKNLKNILKRFKARARGMGARIIKPTSHIFVEVTKEQ